MKHPYTSVQLAAVTRVSSHAAEREAFQAALDTRTPMLVIDLRSRGPRIVLDTLPARDAIPCDVRDAAVATLASWVRSERVKGVDIVSNRISAVTVTEYDAAVLACALASALDGDHQALTELEISDPSDRRPGKE